MTSRPGVLARPLAAVFLLAVACLSTGCGAKAAATRHPLPGSASSVATIEGSDPRLTATLLAERLAPSASAHLQVAREYARLGILDSAERRVKRSLAREPRNAAAHELLGRIWRDWGRSDIGLGHVHRALYFAADSASAHNTLGTIFDALGRVDEARGAYRKAFELDQNAGWALSNLCHLEFRQGLFEEARRQCRAALLVMPTLVEAHNNLALSYAGSGDMGEAKQAFLAAGDASAGHYNLGIVYLASGRFAEASQAFDAAIGSRPDFTAAKTRAHEIRMRTLAVKDPDRKDP